MVGVGGEGGSRWRRGEGEGGSRQGEWRRRAGGLLPPRRKRGAHCALSSPTTARTRTRTRSPSRPSADGRPSRTAARERGSRSTARLPSPCAACGGGSGPVRGRVQPPSNGGWDDGLRPGIDLGPAVRQRNMLPQARPERALRLPEGPEAAYPRRNCSFFFRCGVIGGFPIPCGFPLRPLLLLPLPLPVLLLRRDLSCGVSFFLLCEGFSLRRWRSSALIHSACSRHNQ